MSFGDTGRSYRFDFFQTTILVPERPQTLHLTALRPAGLRLPPVVRLLGDLRPTFASLLLQNGESVVYVKEQLGRASIQITVDTYGHLIPGATRAAVDALDDAPNASIRNPGATGGVADGPGGP